MSDQKIIKYEAVEYVKEINRVAIERETDVSVWIDGRRRAKSNEYSAYFDTWEEAKSHLLEIASQKVLLAQVDLKRQVTQEDEVKALEEPK